MAGAERPYYPPRPTDGGSGQPAGCDSPMRWDDDDEDHGGGGGDGMTAVAVSNPPFLSLSLSLSLPPLTRFRHCEDWLRVRLVRLVEFVVILKLVVWAIGWVIRACCVIVRIMEEYGK